MLIAWLVVFLMMVLGLYLAVYGAPWWAYAGLVMGFLVLTNGFWFFVEWLVPFWYDDQPWDSLDEHLDQFWFRGGRNAELVIIEQTTGKVLRIRKHWKVFRDMGGPIYLVFLAEALNPETVNIETLEKRMSWGQWAVMPKDKAAAPVAPPVGSPFWFAYGRGLMRGRDAGKAALTLGVSEGIAYSPEATERAKVILAFILEELYGLPRIARYRVRVDGHVFWQRDARVGPSYTKGVRWLPFGQILGKPYRWHGAGRDSWRWLGEYFRRRRARRAKASHATPSDEPS